MRKLLLSSTVALGALVLAPAGYADVFIEATVEKDKDVSIVETINIDKTIDIDGLVTVNADKAAEALALVNQDNYANTACTNCAEKFDVIRESFSNNSGITTWNQSSGNGNNQGNAVSAAIDTFVGETPPPGTPSAPGGGFADAQAHGSQYNGTTGPDIASTIAGRLGDPDRNVGPSVPRAGNAVDTINLLFRDTIMENAGIGNTGILFLNQSTGNFNNQGNALALAASFSDEGVALAESDLGQWNTGNRVQESDQTTGETVEGELQGVGTGINKAASITGSLNGNSGIVGVNQAAGNMANQGNFFSVAFAQSGN